jgi:hypothetical protein
MHINNE